MKDSPSNLNDGPDKERNATPVLSCSPVLDDKRQNNSVADN